MTGTKCWTPTVQLKPLKSQIPSAPSGNLERWLVTHKRTGGVIGVTWNHLWHAARERAELFYKTSRDDLVLDLCPRLPGEVAIDGFSVEGLASRLGKKMHVERVVTDVNHEHGVITLGTLGTISGTPVRAGDWITMTRQNGQMKVKGAKVKLRKGGKKSRRR